MWMKPLKIRGCQDLKQDLKRIWLSDSNVKSKTINWAGVPVIVKLHQHKSANKIHCQPTDVVEHHDFRLLQTESDFVIDGCVVFPPNQFHLNADLWGGYVTAVQQAQFDAAALLSLSEVNLNNKGITIRVVATFESSIAARGFVLNSLYQSNGEPTWLLKTMSLKI